MEAARTEDSSSRSAKWRSWVLGCGTLLALAILMIILIYYWAVTPGPQVPSGSFLGVETLGVAHLQGLRGDPAVEAMTGAILRAMNRVQEAQLEQSEVPTLLRWFARNQGDVDEERIGRALRDAPREATIQLESVSGSEDPQIIAVINLNRYPRALRLAYLIGTMVQGSEPVAGHRVLRLGPEEASFFVFVEDTLLWGPSRQVIRQALERGQTASPEQVPSRVLATFSNRQERWNLFGTVENRQQCLAWLVDLFRRRWPEMPPRPELDEILKRIGQVDFGLDVATEDSLEGFLELICGSPKQAEEISGLLESLIEVSGRDPHFSLEVESNQERVRVFLHFSHFVQFVVDSVRGTHGGE